MLVLFKKTTQFQALFRSELRATGTLFTTFMRPDSSGVFACENFAQMGATCTIWLGDFSTRIIRTSEGAKRSQEVCKIFMKILQKFEHFGCKKITNFFVKKIAFYGCFSGAVLVKKIMKIL